RAARYARARRTVKTKKRGRRRPGNSLEELLLRPSRRRRVDAPAEVRVGERGGDPALRRAHQVAFLDEEGLVDVLDGVALLGDRSGERLDPDRTPREAVDDGEQQRAVHLVEARLVDVEEAEPVARDDSVDLSLGPHLGEVAHAPEEPVRDARRAPRAAGDLGPAVVVEGRAQDGGRAAQDSLQVIGAVEVEPEGRPES